MAAWRDLAYLGILALRDMYQYTKFRALQGSYQSQEYIHFLRHVKVCTVSSQSQVHTLYVVTIFCTREYITSRPPLSGTTTKEGNYGSPQSKGGSGKSDTSQTLLLAS